MIIRIAIIILVLTATFSFSWKSYKVDSGDFELVVRKYYASQEVSLGEYDNNKITVSKFISYQKYKYDIFDTLFVFNDEFMIDSTYSIGMRDNPAFSFEFKNNESTKIILLMYSGEYGIIGQKGLYQLSEEKKEKLNVSFQYLMTY